MPAAEEGAFLSALRSELPSGVALYVGADPLSQSAIRVLIEGVPTREQLDTCPRLERVIIPYAGVPEKTRELLAAQPHIGLHNLHHNAAPAAELALALMLAAVKRIVPHDRDLRGGDWRRRYRPPETTTLAGRQVLVLGYGAIGRRVARACQALGMTVSAIRRSQGAPDSDQVAALYPPDALRELLPDAQVLFLCLPLTPETAGLIGPEELGLMPLDACLVNVGRGPLVDERALFECLRGHPLFCAGLDVWYRYPRSEQERGNTVPSSYPFHELENVVLSPHRGGLTRQNELQRAQALALLLRAVADATPVPNQVDLEQGY